MSIPTAREQTPSIPTVLPNRAQPFPAVGLGRGRCHREAGLCVGSPQGLSASLYLETEPIPSLPSPEELVALTADRPAYLSAPGPQTMQAQTGKVSCGETSKARLLSPRAASCPRPRPFPWLASSPRLSLSDLTLSSAVGGSQGQLHHHHRQHPWVCSDS